MQPLKLPSLSEFRQQRARLELDYFVNWATPAYSRPLHLGPLVSKLERAARGECIRVVCSAPPRHAKTETVLHFIAWALWQWPHLSISYSTYADRLSRSKSRKARALAEKLGVLLAPGSRSLNEWRTMEGGGLLAGGVGGPLTGHGVNIGLIDDPVKNRLEAESAAKRQAIEDWAHDVLTTRVEPGGSIFCFMTRWHPDDLSGLLLREGFEHIHLPAISDDGRPLWPERWPLDELERKRAAVGPYTWESLYQGRPRPRGASVFSEPHTYKKLPNVYRAAGGLDLSYSAKTSSDHSAFVKMARLGDVFFVVEAMRHQVRAPEFKKLVHLRCAAEPTVRTVRWYTSTTERGVGELFATGDDAVPVNSILARGDKHTRAIAYAAAWNAGRVLVPEGEPWVDEFVAEHMAFTGVNDSEDDQVDASVAAFDELAGGDEEVSGEPAEPTERTGIFYSQL